MDWLVDRLETVAPSPGQGVDKKDTVWSDPTAIPQDPLIKDMMTALDEDFVKFPLTLSYLQGTEVQERGLSYPLLHTCGLCPYTGQGLTLNNGL